MKKYSILFLLALSASFIIFGCGKDDEEQQEESSITVVKFLFNEESELDDWAFRENDSATMVIDKENKVEGAGSLKIQDGCCVIGVEQGYSVEKNTNYKISLDVKYTEMPDEWSCGGAFKFMLYLEQGSNWEDFGLLQDQTGWYHRELYFNSGEEGLPIQIKIRSELKDIWIDQFIVEEVD
jgi:hypothetical protein